MAVLTHILLQEHSECSGPHYKSRCRLDEDLARQGG